MGLVFEESWIFINDDEEVIKCKAAVWLTRQSMPIRPDRSAAAGR